MKKRRPRGLSPDDQELWRRAVETAEPLRASVGAAIQVPKPVSDRRPLPQPPQKIKHFRLGENRNGGGTAHQLQPNLEDSFLRGPTNMDKRNFERLRRGKMPIDGRIDLHGMTLMQAHPALIGFLRTAHSDGKRLVLVITGKGRAERGNGHFQARRGALRHEVPQWLRQPPLAHMVLQIQPAQQKDGGAGAYYVYLRRQR